MSDLELCRVCDLSNWEKVALSYLDKNGCSFIDNDAFHSENAETSLFTKLNLPAVPVWSKKTISPLLTHEQEKALFLQYNYARFRVTELLKCSRTRCNVILLMKWHKKALYIRNYLAEMNLKLVYSLLGKMRTDKIDSEELLSLGQEMLLHAIDKFDVREGSVFSTYAYWVIIRAWKKENKKLSQHLERFPISYGENLEEEFSGKSYFAAKIGRSDCRRNDEQLYEIDSLIKIIDKNMADLNDDELSIIRLRYLCEGKKPTVEKVSIALDIKKHNVIKLERSALSKLHRTLREKFLAK